MLLDICIVLYFATIFPYFLENILFLLPSHHFDVQHHKCLDSTTSLVGF